jgi:hypothetical protein
MSHDAVADYLTGLRTTRTAKTLFVAMVTLGLLFHIGGFVGVMWFEFLESPGEYTDPLMPDPVVPDQKVIPEVTSIQSPNIHLVQDRTEELPPTATARAFGMNWKKILANGLPLSEFISRISTIMLIAVFTMAALLASAGRLAGAGSFVSAALRATLALVLIFPWAHYLSGVQIPGAFISYSELASLDLSPQGLGEQAVMYARFLGYPLLVLIIVLTASARYNKGYRRLRQHVQAQLQARTI